MKASAHKLPGRYKGGRRVGHLIEARTRHALAARHQELDRELMLALAKDDDADRRRTIRPDG